MQLPAPGHVRRALEGAMGAVLIGLRVRLSLEGASMTEPSRTELTSISTSFRARPGEPPIRRSSKRSLRPSADRESKVPPWGEAGSNRFAPVVDPACGFPRSFRSPSSRTADRKSAGTSDVLEVPVVIGGPSRTRTLDPLIKSHFGERSMGHHRTESATITRLERAGPGSILCVA
jgi:hypothetical protein